MIPINSLIYRPKVYVNRQTVHLPHERADCRHSRGGGEQGEAHQCDRVQESMGDLSLGTPAMPPQGSGGGSRSLITGFRLSRCREEGYEYGYGHEFGNERRHGHGPGCEYEYGYEHGYGYGYGYSYEQKDNPNTKPSQQHQNHKAEAADKRQSQANPKPQLIGWARKSLRNSQESHEHFRKKGLAYRLPCPPSQPQPQLQPQLRTPTQPEQYGFRTYQRAELERERERETAEFAVAKRYHAGSPSYPIASPRSGLDHLPFRHCGNEHEDFLSLPWDGQGWRDGRSGFGRGLPLIAWTGRGIEDEGFERTASIEAELLELRAERARRVEIRGRV